jgi:hypothetical protein
MIHCEMVRSAIEAGASEMDDGRGAFEYKHRLGGTLVCERSVMAVRRGWCMGLRLRLAIGFAYLAHVFYRRIWFDWLRAQLRLAPRPLLRHHIRTRFLADLHRRTQFKLVGGVTMTEQPCRKAPEWCPLRAKAPGRPSA